MKTENRMNSVLTFAVVAMLALAFTTAAHATVVAPTTYFGHNIQGGGGISSLHDDNPQGVGFTKPDVNDPGTWTASGQHWQDDWQGNGPISGSNGKVGWAAFDFGSVQSLDEIAIWNVSEATAQGRRVNTYNIYYSNSPGNALVSGNGNAAASLDYDFLAGGWTQLGPTKSLLQWQNGTGADGLETLGVSAQYIGLEFITYGGDSQRVGLNEVVFTSAPPAPPAPAPEPSTMILAAMGMMGLVGTRRRRNRS